MRGEDPQKICAEHDPDCQNNGKMNNKKVKLAKQTNRLIFDESIDINFFTFFKCNFSPSGDDETFLQR